MMMQFKGCIPLCSLIAGSKTFALNAYDLDSTTHTDINNLRSPAQSGLPSDTFGVPIILRTPPEWLVTMCRIRVDRGYLLLIMCQVALNTSYTSILITDTNCIQFDNNLHPQKYDMCTEKAF